MFTLNTLPPQINPTLVQKLVRAEPATIGHFRDWGFMHPGIKAMQQDVRIAGTAVTVHQPRVDGTIIGYALGQLGSITSFSTRNMGSAIRARWPRSCRRCLLRQRLASCACRGTITFT